MTETKGATYHLPSGFSSFSQNWPLIAWAPLFILSLVLFWPGIVTYDGVDQYQQALSGVFDDWHAPIMARMWQLLIPLGPKAAPMLVLQLATYWFGLGLLAAGAGGRRAFAILVVGALPPFLGWQGIVLKDGQMVGALLTATGLVAYWRLRGRAIPIPALLGVALFMAYATLLRANALFSTIPLAVLLAPVPRSLWGKFGTIAIATLAVLAVSPVINHGPLGASRSGIEKVEAIYDLSAIAVRTDDAEATGLSPSAIAAIKAQHCVKSLFWDPLGEVMPCKAAVKSLDAESSVSLYLQLASAVMRHPVPYITHRLAHLNSTERWLVPLHWPFAAPPFEAEPNALGLGNPGRAAAIWQRLAGYVVETPLGWPIVWIIVAISGLVAALDRAPDATREMALALFASALAQEASFGFLSIASDLRYHLWPMLAAALGSALISDKRWSRGPWVCGMIALIIVVTAGIAARIILPQVPTTYSDLLV
jgi:hypothetical protein